jgi:hypothetical protein
MDAAARPGGAMPNARDTDPAARPMSERAEKLARVLRETIEKSKGLIEDADRLLKRSRKGDD